MILLRFPELKFVHENTFSQQFAHIRSELNEVWQELEVNYPVLYNPERVAEELVDLIVSAETGLRILQKEHEINLDLIANQVVSKNAVRGYENDNIERV